MDFAVADDSDWIQRRGIRIVMMLHDSAHLWTAAHAIQCSSSSCDLGPSEFHLFEVAVNLRPTVSHDQFFFLLKISFRQLRVCYLVAPSLTRGRVCDLLYNCFWALPEQSLLGRSPADFTAIFYCLICDSPNLEGQVPIFMSPRNRVAQFTPGHWVPLASLMTRRATVEVF
jgi:hypothetical protein